MCNVCVLCGLVKCHEIRRALGVLPFPAFSSAIQKNNTHFKPIYDATVQVAKVYPLYRSFLACKSALGLLLFLWRLARSKSLWLTSVLIKYSIIFRIKIIWYLEIIARAVFTYKVLMIPTRTRSLSYLCYLCSTIGAPLPGDSAALYCI